MSPPRSAQTLARSRRKFAENSVRAPSGLPPGLPDWPGNQRLGYFVITTFICFYLLSHKLKSAGGLRLHQRDGLGFQDRPSFRRIRTAISLISVRNGMSRTSYRDWRALTAIFCTAAP